MPLPLPNAIQTILLNRKRGLAMDAYIENTTLETPELLREVICHMNRKGLLRRRLICGIAAVAFLVFGLLMEKLLYVIAAAVYAGGFIWYLIHPWWQARKTHKQKLAAYNQVEQPVFYRFFDDHYEVSDIDSWNSFPYERITAVVRLKVCIVIQTDEKSCSGALSIDGFQKSSAEELMAFLRSKCPQVNPANWQW